MGIACSVEPDDEVPAGNRLITADPISPLLAVTMTVSYCRVADASVIGSPRVNASFRTRQPRPVRSASAALIPGEVMESDAAGGANSVAESRLCWCMRPPRAFIRSTSRMPARLLRSCPRRCIIHIIETGHASTTTSISRFVHVMVTSWEKNNIGAPGRRDASDTVGGVIWADSRPHDTVYTAYSFKACNLYAANRSIRSRWTRVIVFIAP